MKGNVREAYVHPRYKLVMHGTKVHVSGLELVRGMVNLVTAFRSGRSDGNMRARLAAPIGESLVSLGGEGGGGGGMAGQTARQHAASADTSRAGSSQADASAAAPGPEPSRPEPSNEQPSRANTGPEPEPRTQSLLPVSCI